MLLLAPAGAVHLFFKVGKRISEWQTWLVVSEDGGATSTAPRELVPGDRGGRGPVKNKPIVTSDGAWLAPASVEAKSWNKQIGARLLISERTVATHIRNILKSLGFDSRAQIASWMASSRS